MSAPVHSPRTALGMKLPMACTLARNTADNCMRAQIPLAESGDAVSFKSVVAGLPQGSGAPCPNRYPSPDRRRRAPLRTPPFFRVDASACAYRQKLAQMRVGRTFGFDADAILPSDMLAQSADKKRGSIKCSEQSKDNLKLYWRSSSCRPSRPAATRSASRASSVRVQAWPGRPCWVPIWRLAPWSALPATSPSVRPFQNAAPNTRRKATAPSDWTIRAIMHGWSFSFIARN